MITRQHKHTHDVVISGKVSSELIFTPSRIRRNQELPHNVKFKVKQKIKTITDHTGLFCSTITQEYELIAFGEIALHCCRYLSEEKQVDALCTVQMCFGRLFNTVSFVVNQIMFGEESRTQIEYEICHDIRPHGWNDPTHSDYQYWQHILQCRRDVKPNPRRERFGFARVVGHNKRAETGRNMDIMEKVLRHKLPMTEVAKQYRISPVVVRHIIHRECRKANGFIYNALNPTSPQDTNKRKYNRFMPSISFLINHADLFL